MPAPTWTDAVDLCRDAARHDVRAGGWVRPSLLGFEGDDLLALVELRPHPDHEYEDPLIEALSLLVPLGADRIAFLASGRVWSLDDPIPPVTDGLDLRQSVAMVLCVDRHGRTEPVTTSVLLPFDRLASGLVVWQDPVEIDEEAEGPISTLLRLVLSRIERDEYDDLTLGRQALRLVRLGHDLGFPEGDGADLRLAECLHLALESELAGEPQPPWTLAQSWS